ncbi:MAG: SDR family NAD(P)-dependent oxidoreductase [Bdellovibrionales bacterium]|nr:SDR family NAD(P)-dependent oxidoreductase [Bdellovibrionales bacterium]
MAKKQNDIAIVGMACWYPGAKNIMEFWENILTRRRQFRRMIDKRFPLDVYYDPDRKAPDKTYSSQASFIDGFEFDWAQNRFPKSAYESTDLVHWLALDVSTKAVHDAKLSRNTIPVNKTGVIVGNSLTGDTSRSNGVRLRWPYFEKVLVEAAKLRGMNDEDLRGLLEFSEKICKDTLPPITEDTLAGSLANTIAGRIANYFDLDGGGFTVDGACASSLLAVANSATSLAVGDLDLAVCGGVDLSIDPFEIIGFSKVGALAEKEMRVYDREGKGFIPGEGCGFVIMKRLEDAVRDKDKIYSVLKGWGISSDGSGGITAPKSSGQAKAIQRAYEKAGYNISDCHFIEGHGTGTTVGDRRELEGLSMVAKETGSGPRAIGMTSLKSIIGHTKAAAGIGSFIKACIAVNRRVAPPTSGCENHNPVFDQGAIELFPLIKGKKFRKNEKVRAGVSAMGFGGINCHVTLESYAEPALEVEPSIPEDVLMASFSKHELFLFTAQTVQQLKDDLQKWKKEAMSISFAELTDIAAHLAQLVSPTMPFRASLLASSPQDLLSKLEELEGLTQKMPGDGETMSNSSHTVWVSNKAVNPKVGFIFPGQGSQKINMGAVLKDRFRWAKKMTSQANNYLKDNFSIDLSNKIYKDSEIAKSSEDVKLWVEDLKQTQIAQPAICMTSTLWAHRLKDLGVNPQVVCGHSLGELTALHWAGAYDFKNLIQISAVRGKLMMANSENPGSMLSLSCDGKTAQDLIAQVDSIVAVANMNGPKQTVVSGELDGIKKVAKLASDQGISCQELNVSNAFHSPLVQEAADLLKESIHLEEMVSSFRFEFLSGIDSKAISPEESIGDYLSRQIISPVNLVELVKELEGKCDILIEVGPGSVMSSLVKGQCDPEKLKVFPVESKPGDEQSFLKALAVLFACGVDLRGDRIFANRLTRPFVPFKEKKFIESPCEKPLHISDELQNYLQSKRNPSGVAVKAGAPITPSHPSVNVESLPAKVIPMETKRVSTNEAMQSHDVKEALIGVLTQVTGFPSDTFNMEMRLLDDLNMDSIKAGEVVTQISDICSIEMNNIDPIQLANATLGEIVEMIVALNPVRSTFIETEVVAKAAGSEYIGNQQVTSSVMQRPFVPVVSVVPTSVGAPPLSKPETVTNQDVDPQAVLYSALARVTGFDTSILDPNMRLLDDLNLDSIKAGEVVSELRSHFPNAGEIDPIQFANATIEDIVDFFKQGAGSGPIKVAPAPALSIPNPERKVQNILDLVKAEFALLSGYDLSTLSGNQDPQDDLRMTPQQIVEAMRSLFDKNRLDFNVDSDQLLGKNLEQLSFIFKSVKESAKAHSFPLQEKIQSEEKPWVRNFKMNLVERESDNNFASGFDQRQMNDLSKARVLVIHNHDALVAEMSQKFLGAGSIFKDMDFASVQKMDPAELSEFSMVILLQEREVDLGMDPVERLKKTIERFQFLATLPKSKMNSRRATTIACIQFGDGMLGFGEFNQNYSLSHFPSFLQTIHIERPENRIRCLDIAMGLGGEQAIQKILQELVGPDDFSVVGFDAKGVRRILDVEGAPSSEYKERNIPWESKDVVLVTGGGKGITAECALAFAKQHKVKMALVGSSSAPSFEEIQSKKGELATNIKRFQDADIDVQYYSCDISNQEALQAIVGKIQEDLGPIRGIIHGAGRNIPRRVSQVSPEQAFEEMAPKLMGMINLLEMIDGDSLKLLVGFTSIIGVMGVPGNAWYGFANHSLRQIITDFGKKHSHLQTICCGFGMWDGVGMAVKLGSGEKLASTGARLIPMQEGIARFLDLTQRDPGVDQVIVTSRLWKNSILSPNLAKAKAFRFLESLTAATKGVEVISRVHLDLAQDLYLKDHKYSSTYLFPAVFGVEAMAEVAAFLLGEDHFDHVVMENLDFQSAVVVKPDKPTEIEISALAHEEVDSEGNIRIDVKIVTIHNQSRKDSFSGTVVVQKNFEQEATSPFSGEQALPINIKKEVYGPVLFHGSDYQRLQEFYELTEKEAQFKLLRKKNDTNTRQAFAENGKKLILGDAFFRDSLLQSTQVVESNHVVLPIHCDRWEMVITPDEEKSYHAKYETVSENEKRIKNNIICFSVDGKIYEHLKGAEAVVVKKRKQPISLVREKRIPEEASSTPSQLLQEKARRMALMSGQKPAFVEVLQMKGFADFAKEERHKYEQKLFELCKKQIQSSESDTLKLDWNDQGKPIVKGLEEWQVSISHKKDYCICALMKSPIGLDFESIDIRDLAEWKSLLGPDFGALFENLAEKTERKDLIGTLLWSAREAAFKILGEKEFVFHDAKLLDDGALFRMNYGAQNFIIQAVEVKMPDNKSYVFSQAFIAKESHLDESEIFVPHNEAFKVGLNEQKGFYIRWPITFKDSSSPHKNVYFSKFAEWQGRAREIAFWPLLEEASKIFKKGDSGWVTNHSETRIFASMQVGDLLEVRLSSSEISGSQGSTVELIYDWYRVDGMGQERIAAQSRMQITWVEVIGHGKVKVAPFPDSFLEFFSSVAQGAQNSPPATREALKGSLIYEAPKGVSTEPYLSSQVFNTTLEDSNLVGNIYFSNYTVWQGKTRDHFLESVVPQILDLKSEGEPHTTRYYIKHLRELMPFEQVEVVMKLKSLHEFGFNLYFEYYKFEHGIRTEKLAYSDHEIVWARSSRDEIEPMRLPEMLEYYLRKVIADHKKGVA